MSCFIIRLFQKIINRTNDLHQESGRQTSRHAKRNHRHARICRIVRNFTNIASCIRPGKETKTWYSNTKYQRKMCSFITYRRVYLPIIFTIGIRSQASILQSPPLNSFRLILETDTHRTSPNSYSYLLLNRLNGVDCVTIAIELCCYLKFAIVNVLLAGLPGCLHYHWCSF